MTFICRPVSVDIWYTLNFYLNKKKNKNKNEKKTIQKKFDVSTRVPRRARWDFRGVLEDNFYIWNLTWINIWRIGETAKYWEWNWGDFLFLVAIFFYLWKLPCAAMFLLAILGFSCIECFAYALASPVFNYSYVWTRTATVLYPILFFSVLSS